MDNIFFKSLNDKLHDIQVLHESDPRISGSKSIMLDNLSIVSHNMDEAIRHLNKAYKSAVLLDKTSANSSNETMLQRKVEQAAKMTEKLDSFVNQLYTFVEDIKI